MKNLCSNLYPDGFDYGPCDGGNAQMSAAYLTRGNGPVQETDDPYLLPMPSTISSINLTPVLDVDEITFLPPRTGPLDNSLYKQTLMDEGAIQIWFQINISCFTDNDTTYYLPDGGTIPLRVTISSHSSDGTMPSLKRILPSRHRVTGGPSFSKTVGGAPV